MLNGDQVLVMKEITIEIGGCEEDWKTDMNTCGGSTLARNESFAFG